ncbi:Exonuclease SbcC [Vibrio aestuarianus]|uniref:AAA family ATPase n=1 Tax=Vibrio aestuarianus TaxID=28171 RepID=UPI0014561FFD|nr:AAA family ATPase [Vibrio aestuarianus]NLS63613.1 AAA family ATPase [Vibrio aestuarianus subsp. francensis]CAH8188905.1 Exonuclease SbcC [Vibrio aestuarianus]
MSLSKLFINRLVVHGSGKIVYDQKFHLGVNIIRGKNGTGKSTIMDLLNYGLGAEITEWTEHQIQCDWVALEVTVNGHIVTLKRDITPTGQGGSIL